MPMDGFAKADGNKDGALTIAEVKLADPAVTQADFDKADADKSKSLSKAEFDKWAMAKPADKAGRAPTAPVPRTESSLRPRHWRP
jgi:hypothetical protein